MTTNKWPLIFAGLAILVFVVDLVGITQSYPGRELLALFTGFGEDHWDTLDNCREAAFAVGLTQEQTDSAEVTVRGLARAIRTVRHWMGTALILALMASPIVLLYRWLYRDAKSRGKDGCLVMILCVIFGWVGWLLWLILRPGKEGEG